MRFIWVRRIKSLTRMATRKTGEMRRREERAIEKFNDESWTDVHAVEDNYCEKRHKKISTQVSVKMLLQPCLESLDLWLHRWISVLARVLYQNRSQWSTLLFRVSVCISSSFVRLHLRRIEESAQWFEQRSPFQHRTALERYRECTVSRGYLDKSLVVLQGRIWAYIEVTQERRWTWTEQKRV